MKLFVVMVGGDTPNSNIEVHDIRFVVGDTIEDCFEQLKEQWWGVPESLHLDCWGSLEVADGYKISLKNTPSSQNEALYFVHMGGYSSQIFSELHHNVFLVGTSIQEVLDRASSDSALASWNLPHKDNLFEIDKVINLQTLLKQHGLYVHLEKTEEDIPFVFTCDYVPFAKPDFKLTKPLS